MPRSKLPPYTCPRCGFSTDKKDRISYHLFKMKRQCPALVAVLDLTDDIKKFVMDNRIYREQVPQVIKTFVTNYNQINNFNAVISNMDDVKKLERYMTYKGEKIAGFASSIRLKYSKRAKEYAKDTLDNVELFEEEGLVNVVDDATVKCDTNMSSHNVIYDGRNDELKIYDGYSWENMGVDQGIRQYVRVIKEYFLDEYERYLLRSMKSTHNLRKRVLFKEMLESYYRFIGCFKLDPYCKERSDNVILAIDVDDDEEDDTDDDDNEDDEDDDDKEDEDEGCDEDARSCFSSESVKSIRITYKIEEEFYPFYKVVCKDLKAGDVSKMTRRVGDIVKRNAKKNMAKLNTLVTDMFHMDDGFRKMMMSWFQSSALY